MPFSVPGAGVTGAGISEDCCTWYVVHAVHVSIARTASAPRTRITMTGCKLHTKRLRTARSRAVGLARRSVLVAACFASGCSLAYVRPEARPSQPLDAQHEAAPA